MIQLTKADFANIGLVATHCDERKLQIAITEAIRFDLRSVLCSNYVDVVDNWESETEPWPVLISGGTFTNCAGKTDTLEGLKTVLAYFAYSRYIVLNNFNDTPNGGVTKTNEWSLPKPLQELRQFADKYRSMALELWKRSEGYICLNRDAFGLTCTNCASCGCNGCLCEGIRNTKGFGLSGKNISKYGVQ